MVAPATTLWSPQQFCLSASTSDPDLSDVATTAYELVCRVDFSAPGFCLIDLQEGVTSQTQRGFMLSLKRAMHRLHAVRTGRDLVYLSAARFDQQVTTKLHRDSGPDECFLMLGYEPSPVSADLAVADFSLCAHDRGLSPQQLLTLHNPMFGPGEELLGPYTTRINCFSNLNHQVLLVNNSIAAPSNDRNAWLGLLHSATVHNPSDALRRVLNSTLIASVPAGTPETVSRQEQEQFAATDVVRRRGYDRRHLEDDS